jgi:plasmid stability protein
MMATLTIPNVDQQTMLRLKVRAQVNGRSLDRELRFIIQNALATEAFLDNEQELIA